MKSVILFEDNYIIICIKSAGIISEEGGMPDILASQLGLSKVYCVHRLDKDVSGIMLFAKDGKTAALCSELFSSGKILKEYYAIAVGRSLSSEGTFKDLLFHDKRTNKTFIVNRMRNGVKSAELDYHLLNTFELNGKTFSSYRIALKTGRSHQIRVQFASRDMPLLGDRKYGGPSSDCGIALMSHSLSFKHPISKKDLTFSIPAPASNPWNYVFQNIGDDN